MLVTKALHGIAVSRTLAAACNSWRRPCFCRSSKPHGSKAGGGGGSANGSSGKKRGRHKAAARGGGGGEEEEDAQDAFLRRGGASSSRRRRGDGSASAGGSGLLADLMRAALEAGVAQLTDMGYSRSKALDALQECNCDVAAAVEYLTAACC